MEEGNKSWIEKIKEKEPKKTAILDTDCNRYRLDTVVFFFVSPCSTIVYALWLLHVFFRNRYS